VAVELEMQDAAWRLPGVDRVDCDGARSPLEDSQGVEHPRADFADDGVGGGSALSARTA